MMLNDARVLHSVICYSIYHMTLPLAINRQSVLELFASLSTCVDLSSLYRIAE